MMVILLAMSVLAEVPVYYYKKASIIDNINYIQMSKAQHIAQEIDVKIKGRIKSIDAISGLISQVDLHDHAKLVGYLQNCMDLVSYFSLGLAVMDHDGKTLIADSMPYPAHDILTLDDAQWFDHLKKEGGVVVSRPYRAEGIGALVMVFAAAIRDISGNLTGVLAAPVLLDSPEFLGFAYEKENDEYFGELLVVSRSDKLIVASPNADLILTATPEQGTISLQDKAMEGFSGVGVAEDKSDYRVVAAVANIKSANWYVVVNTPADVVFRPVMEEIRKDVTTYLVFILAMVTTIFITLNVYFRPLKIAAEKVRTMGGDKALPYLPHTTDDEIGDLMSGFNTLVAAVNERTEELEKANAQLEALSQTDGLTKVSNRRWFDHSLQQYWRVHQRTGQPLSLIILDIDHFKKYNDSYGHLQGDACLASVAKVLNGSLKRPTDIFARYGGEEFAAIVENDEAGALGLAEAMRRAVEGLALEHRESSHGIVTVSLGVATLVPDQETSADILITSADSALYESKEKGRNRVKAYAAESR